MRLALPDDPDQIRGADILYLSVEQATRLGSALRDEYVPEAPALVVEVISPSESATYSNEKMTDYLTAGCRLVWQVFPRTRSIRIYRADGTTSVVPFGGVLDGEDVLPGFNLNLGELFG
jgi:Uma2 family endonuclease